MAEATTNTTTIIARADQHDIDLHKASDRVNFGSIREPIDVPYLLGVQTDSFDWLIGNERWQKRVQEDLENGTNTVPHTSGLDEVFQEISPIENFAQTMSLTFSDPYFEEPRHTVQECKEKDYTYSAPLYVNAEFENGDTGEIKSQTVFMGDFPLQTPHGTFIIGGTERVIVSQLVRSPGVYFDRSQDRTSDKEVFGAKIIPSRGAWLEFEIDKKDQPQVRVDRKRKHIAVLRLLGFTSPAVGLYIIFQGVILTLLAYGGGILLYLSGSALFNRTLASSQSTEQMICRITPFHSLLALILALTVAILVTMIGARRAIAIQPAESLREL